MSNYDAISLRSVRYAKNWHDAEAPAQYVIHPADTVPGQGACREHRHYL